MLHALWHFLLKFLTFIGYLALTCIVYWITIAIWHWFLGPEDEDDNPHKKIR